MPLWGGPPDVLKSITTPQEGLSGGTDMAHWIRQTLHIDEHAEIVLGEIGVWVGNADQEHPAPAEFKPETREDANSMAIALRLAAKRLEDIGKGLE